LIDEGTPTSPPVSEPVTPESPSPAPVAPATPDEAALLKARLEEKDAFIGRQSTELGTLRNELGYLRSMVEQVQQARPQEPVEQPTERTRAKIDWDHPDESLEHWFESKMQARERTREQHEQTRRAQMAEANFSNSWELAKQSDPKLYEGIEDKVRFAVQNTFRSGMLNEYSITPKTIKRAAQLIWLEEGKPDKIVPHTPTPTKPIPTETPSGRPISTEEVSVEVSESDYKWGESQGLTRKQTEEIIQKELGEAARGNNRRAIVGR